MSTNRRSISEWKIEATSAGLRVHREGDDRLTVTLQITRLGEPVALAPLVLTVDEAEQLHAGLCFALGQEAPPVGAPECRKPIRYSGGRQRY
ncbi:hypothetical protein SSPO_048960 [Streptomyces antimycoticus]|uniref:Uncharacterized protein n=1 Tax=Streptomyces antimycoticus TaxID=68175 RepID=A0A499UQH6_9ACTN|nr:hypothetical protein SSPO_048960 [Streptomyces antimycoticus]